MNISATHLLIYRFIKRSRLFNVNPRYWDVNCILETFLAAGRGIRAWPPSRHLQGVSWRSRCGSPAKLGSQMGCSRASPGGDAGDVPPAEGIFPFALFALIHMASYLFYLFFHCCDWQTWICCLCVLLVCPPVPCSGAGGAMWSPGQAGHCSGPHGLVRLCLLRRAGQQLDFPAVCCCCGFHFIVLQCFFLWMDCHINETPLGVFL